MKFFPFRVRTQCQKGTDMQERKQEVISFPFKKMVKTKCSKGIYPFPLYDRIYVADQRALWQELIIEPTHDKTNRMTCAPSEDSDKLGHPPSLIRNFVVCTQWIVKDPGFLHADSEDSRLIWLFATRTYHFFFVRCHEAALMATLPWPDHNWKVYESLRQQAGFAAHSFFFQFAS